MTIKKNLNIFVINCLTFQCLLLKIRNVKQFFINMLRIFLCKIPNKWYFIFNILRHVLFLKVPFNFWPIFATLPNKNRKNCKIRQL